MPQTLSTAATAARLAGTGTQARRLSSTTLVAGLALVVIAFVAWRTAGSVGIGFSSVGFSNIGQVLAPAVLISLFIERAAEVVITSWRSPQVQHLQHEIDVATDDAQIQAQRVLDFYRLETQRIAFVLSFSLAVIAALVGVRVVEPLLDQSAMNSVRRDHLTQWSWLRNLDILLTGLLMAGGADGIHRIITTFTAFLDSTRDRISASVGGGGPLAASAPQAAAPVQQHPAPAAPAAQTAAPVAAAAPTPAISGDYDDGV
jgi:hypothetical protein